VFGSAKQFIMKEWARFVYAKVAASND